MIANGPAVWRSSDANGCRPGRPIPATTRRQRKRAMHEAFDRVETKLRTLVWMAGASLALSLAALARLLTW